MFTAVTRINHGGEDGAMVEFAPGDVLPIEAFAQKDLDGLLSVGAIKGDAEGYEVTESESASADDDDDDDDEDDEDKDK